MGNSGGRDPVVALSSLTPSAAPPPAVAAVPAEPASVITVDLRHIGAEPAMIEDEQRHQLLSPDAKGQEKSDTVQKEKRETRRAERRGEQNPRAWLVLAGITCLLNPVCGAYACQMSRESRKERRKGNLESAHSYGKSALQFSIQGIAVSMTIAITIFILVVGLRWDHRKNP